MAYTPFTTAEVTAGEPVTQDLFTKVKDDFADHETRITAVEAATSSYRPLEYDIQGGYWGLTIPYTGILYDRINFSMTLLAARLIIVTAGTSGTTTVNVEYKRGAGSWTTIFTTKPSVAYTAGDLAVSTNAVLAVTSLQAGDFLRVNIDTVQQVTFGLKLQLEYEV